MSLSGTRGLIRVSRNPTCELQAGMVAERVPELEFFRRVTSRDYQGEYGERVSARRRGAKFEANLHQNNAAELRRVLAPTFSLDAAAMVVRNFAEEVPGTRNGIRAVRLYRTRLILRDLAAGREVPDLLIQPQLAFSVGPGERDYEYVSPDFMVFDPATGIYRPGEEKSFIVRGGVADRADLDGTRRQAAIQILALRAEAARVSLQDRVDDLAVFVFATPYGLKPADPYLESLDGEIREIRRAVRGVRRVRNRLAALRTGIDTPLHALADELPTNFQDSCFGSCIMAEVCRAAAGETVRALGDRAARLVGGDFPADRLIELVGGAVPANARERDLERRLEEVRRVLPWVHEVARTRRSA